MIQYANVKRMNQVLDVYNVAFNAFLRSQSSHNQVSITVVVYITELLLSLLSMFSIESVKTTSMYGKYRSNV